MIEKWVQCPHCHSICAIYDDYHDKKHHLCRTCRKEEFDTQKAIVYKEIALTDVRKPDVLHIKYYSGWFFSGYNIIMARPDDDGNLSIQTKWTLSGSGFMPPKTLDGKIWHRMLFYLFDVAKLNTWNQDDYYDGSLDGTEWGITLTLSDTRVAHFYGCAENFPPQWKELNQEYESVMAMAGAEYFNDEIRDSVFRKIREYNNRKY